MDGTEDLVKRFAALSRGDANKMILGQFGLLAVRYAKENIRPHRRTGNLERTIRVDDVNERNQSVTVVAGGTRQVGYAAVVEYGSRPHTIVPRRKKALFFSTTGARSGVRLTSSVRNRYRGPGAAAARARDGIIFRKRVNHPGSRPYPYMIPAAQKALRDVGLRSTVIRVWNDAA